MSSRSRSHRFVARFVPVQADEVVPVLWAAAFFACVLASSFVLRGLRESVGAGFGREAIDDLWTGTLVLTAVVNPAYWWLANRMPRRRFVPLTILGIGAVQLLLFGAFAFGTEGSVLHTGVKAFFYIWLSTINLLTTCLAWIVFVDVLSESGARRLFGFIAVGGTVGAFSGSFAARELVVRAGESSLFLASVALLLAAWWCVARLQGHEGTLADTAPRTVARQRDEVASGGVFAGLRGVFQSSTLASIAGFMVLTSLAGSALYLLQTDLVRAAIPGREERSAFYSMVDMLAQSLVLVFQLLLTGNLLRRFGVGVGLVALPLVMMVGFAGLAMLPGLAAFVAIQAARRGVHHGFTTPARNVLFTTLGAEERYKAKSFTDTFTVRAADVVWAFVLNVVFNALGLQQAMWLLVGAAVVWVGVAAWLGRLHRRNLARVAAEPVAVA